MATNPDSIVRLHSRNGGRGSVLESNIPFQIYDNGLLHGNGAKAPETETLSVTVGGTTSAPDIVIATNPAGYKIALDIAGNTNATVPTPTVNNQVSLVIAYTEDLAALSTDTTTTGNPSSCGLIVVTGSQSDTPPDDTAIRSAITADGATGSQAAYAIIASVTVPTGATFITESMIENTEAFFIKMRSEADDPGEGAPLEPNHFVFIYKED